MALNPCATRTNRDGMELVRHGTALFPVGCYHDHLAEEPVPWHWHVEMEGIRVSEGTAEIAAGTERFAVRRGEGFFINSGVLHAVRDQGDTGCRLQSAVFHPRLVGGSADSVFWQEYVQPLLSESGRKCVYLDGSRPWHREAVEAIETAWENCRAEPPGYHFRVRESLSRLVFLLSRSRPAGTLPPPKKALREEERVKRMLQFIQENFAAELTVEDIAKSAMISESECLRCFRNTIGVPPGQYLKQFRIQKAAELLVSAARSAAETGAACGFPDPSYFTKTFRELKGCTPAQYRKQAKAGGRSPQET